MKSIDVNNYAMPATDSAYAKSVDILIHLSMTPES